MKNKIVENTLKKASLITAIKTPYLENGNIDYKTYEDLLWRQIKHQVDGVVVGGTTGEGHLFSWNEHITLIAFTVNKVKDDLIIIGNTGSNNTREAIEGTEMGFAAGMHASLQINPYYGKTSKEGLFQHFDRVLDIGPGLVYNVPSRTAQDITEDVIETIARHDNFVGVKECAGNDRIKYYHEKGIHCWSGNDDQCFEARHNANALGVVSVAANFLPGVFRKLMDDKDAADLNKKIISFLDVLYCQPNPIGINTLLAMSGLCKPAFRLPYFPLSSKEREKLSDIIETLDFEEIPETIHVMFDEELIIN